MNVEAYLLVKTLLALKHGCLKKSLSSLEIGLFFFLLVVLGFLVIIGLVVGYGAIIGGMMIMPIWWACLAISIPAVSVAAILFALKVKETKGANLDEIE